jgi:2,4-dienoyl-CoA reductase-like NADH-dependent reductase (Old Yellow Enzyme family)
MASLLTPFTLKGITLKNRVAVSRMCHLVPAFHDEQAVGNLAVAAAELGGDCAVMSAAAGRDKDYFIWPAACTIRAATALGFET